MITLTMWYGSRLIIVAFSIFIHALSPKIDLSGNKKSMQKFIRYYNLKEI